MFDIKLKFLDNPVILLRPWFCRFILGVVELKEWHLTVKWYQF